MLPLVPHHLRCLSPRLQSSLRRREQSRLVGNVLGCPRPPPPAQVTLVGKVLSASESGLTYGLTIDDGTGTAAVKIWISDDGGWRGGARSWAPV